HSSLPGRCWHSQYLNGFVDLLRFSDLVIALRFAISPTSRSPLSGIPTADGVVRAPSPLAITTGSPPDIIATHEFVVPRSIPITLPMCLSFHSKHPLLNKFHF